MCITSACARGLQYTYIDLVVLCVCVCVLHVYITPPVHVVYSSSTLNHIITVVSNYFVTDWYTLTHTGTHWYTLVTDRQNRARKAKTGGNMILTFK